MVFLKSKSFADAGGNIFLESAIGSTTSGTCWFSRIGFFTGSVPVNWRSDGASLHPSAEDFQCGRNLNDL